MIDGVVEAVEDGSFLMRVGPLRVRLLGSRNLLGALVPGRAVSLLVQMNLVMDGTRMVPACIAFESPLERDLFEALTSVSGVGPRAAVKALSRPASEIGSAVASGDEKLLSTLPGIGRARARQIVAALQEKLSRSFPAKAQARSGAAAEARTILLQLGLPSQEADELLDAVQVSEGEKADASVLVREAMKARGRK